MEDNLIDIVLYSIEKITQNRHIYYQLNRVFEGKRKPDGFPLFHQHHPPNFLVITCFQFIEIDSRTDSIAIGISAIPDSRMFSSWKYFINKCVYFLILNERLYSAGVAWTYVAETERYLKCHFLFQTKLFFKLQ